MSNFVDPGTMFTKESTAASFANQVRDNQVDHEARIVAAENTPPPGAIPAASDMQLWAFAYPGDAVGGSTTTGTGNHQLGSGIWVEGTKYISFTSGWQCNFGDKFGTSEYVYDVVNRSWTGAWASASDTQIAYEGACFSEAHSNYGLTSDPQTIRAMSLAFDDRNAKLNFTIWNEYNWFQVNLYMAGYSKVGAAFTTVSALPF